MYLRKNIKHLSKGEKYQANSDLFIAHSVTENNWISIKIWGEKYKSSISTNLCWSSIIRQQVNNLPVRKHSQILPREKKKTLMMTKSNQPTGVVEKKKEIIRIQHILPSYWRENRNCKMLINQEMAKYINQILRFKKY